MLFVDDDVDLRELVHDAVTRLGVDDCVLAASLAEVEAQRARVLACSLAVLDINLGWHDPSGVEVYAWLRQQGFAGKIVFLTGHGDDDPRVREAARIGSVPILLKPIGLGVLATCVSEAFRGP